MKNLDRQVSFTPDAEGFLNCGNFALAFAAHVSAVNSTVLRGDFCQFDQLIGFCVMTRRIDESSRDPERAIPHSLCGERFHFLEFFRCGRPIGISEHRFTHLCRANIGSDVQRRAGFLQPLEILVQRAPIDFQVVLVKPGLKLSQRESVLRSYGSSLACNFCRDPL